MEEGRPRCEKRGGERGRHSEELQPGKGCEARPEKGCEARGATLALVCQKGREISGLLGSPSWRKAFKSKRLQGQKDPEPAHLRPDKGKLGRRE